MGLRMVFYSHHPEKEDKTSGCEDTGSLKKVVCLSPLPTKAEGETKADGIEY